MSGSPGYPRTVGRVLTRSATRLPDKLALTFADRRWTYAELDRAAGRVAARLLAHGLTPGDRVATYGKNSEAYLLLYLGCARAGLVHVPVNFNARDEEFAYLLTQAGPRAAFVDPSLASSVEQVVARLHETTLGTRDGPTDDDVLSVGEVIYRSPQLCTGYWGKPEETAEAFRGGWFHSGDLCRIDEEGYLFVVDRIKDVINTGGVLVASREVEDAIYEHEAVAEVAVVGLAHERWIEAIAAVVVARSPVAPEELIGLARAPGRPQGPQVGALRRRTAKNASGKLLKRELRDQLNRFPAPAGR